jgi:hypothetical protein
MGNNHKTYIERIKNTPKPDVSGKEQICIKCRESKPFSEFSKYRGSPTGFITECKECRNKKNHQQHFKHIWGLSPEEHEAMKLKQGGRCAICKEVKDLYIDHHHKTDITRGLICRPCNFALGHIKDSIEIAKRIVEYLEEHKSAADPSATGKRCLRPERMNRVNQFGRRKSKGEEIKGEAKQ